jgi:hypothetical protein
MQKKYTLSLILTLGLSISFILFFYGKILVSPNQYMFSNWGDGIKNYFTYAYHIQRDTSFIQFDGMNYPYGEHFMYTDCHPLIADSLKAIARIFPGLTAYSIGILNFFMIISFVFTALVVWLILKEFRVNPLLAIPGSLGMMILAPQVFRMGGHLALSYSFFAPLTIYLSLKCFNENAKLYWQLLLFLNILFWFFIHAYLGMMVSAYVLAYGVIYFIKHFGILKRKMNFYLLMFLQVVIPVVLFLLFIKITDTHSGRTTNPLGFFLSNAEPDDFLIAHAPPLRPLIESIVTVKQYWEAWSYIGLTSVIILIILIINLFQNLIKHRKFVVGEKLLPKGEGRIMMLSGLILLVFAMGFPFKLVPSLLDVFPFIKHFRATGRFTWFFFFAINILSVIILDQWLKNKELVKHKIIMRLFVIIALLFTIIEGWSYHSVNRADVTRNKNLFQFNNLDNDFQTLIKSIDPQHYQAIIPLPFYYIGSENFSIEPSDATVQNSIIISYHTGLPIMGARLTRTSITESKKIIQVISPDYYKKKIQPDLPSEKPFLVIRSIGQLSVYQENLLSKAVLESAGSSVALYELKSESLFSNSANREIKKFDSIKEFLFEKDGFYINDSSTWFRFQDFEDQVSDKVFSGNGAIKQVKSGQHDLAGFQGGTFENGKIYTASMWMFNGQPDALNDWFRLIFVEFNESEQRYIETFMIPEQSQVINGDWSLVEIDFTVQNTQNYTTLILKGKKLDHAEFHLDDLLVREKSAYIYRIDEMKDEKIKWLFYNNQRIEAE